MNEKARQQADARERQTRLNLVRAMAVDEAWRELRQAFEASRSLIDGKEVMTVYEGPADSLALPPLPMELLRDFMRERGEKAADCCFVHAGDPHPLVAAYCLYALSEEVDPRVPEATAQVAARTERIRAVYGSYVWTGTLAGYGRKLYEEHVDVDEEVEEEVEEEGDCDSERDDGEKA